MPWKSAKIIRSLRIFVALSITSLIPPAIAQPTSQPALAVEDFQQLAEGSIPEGSRVLTGEFAVEHETADRFLRLAPTPVHSHGILIGPERQGSTAIRARVRSATKGRRFPEMGVGLGGIGGFRLYLMPVIGEIQIRQNEVIVARAPFSWSANAWTVLLLDIRMVGDKAHVHAKAWPHGAAEPADWLIRYQAAAPPPSGRASLWGSAYSEQPIDFDDVLIEAR